MNPISQTAFYTAGIRMLDAKLPKPICGDSYAEKVMNEQGMAILAKTRKIIGPRITTVQRHQIIDELLQNELNINHKINIIIIGAGFDTRAFRLNGGNWTEVDEPAIIHYKETKLPFIEAKNTLKRIAIEFGKEKIYDKLKDIASNDKVIVVVEGVTMYLTETENIATLGQLKQLFPNHILICDLVTKSFKNRMSGSLRKVLNEMGAYFKLDVNNPQQFIEHQNYVLQQSISIPQTAIEKGNLKIPKWIYWFLKNQFLKGYTVNIFKTTS